MYKLYSYLLISALSLGVFSSAEARLHSSSRSSGLKLATLTPVLGDGQNLKLRVREYAAEPGSAAKPSLKLAINALNLTTKASYPQSFKIKSYYYESDGSEHFLNLTNLTVLNNRYRVKTLEIPIETLNESQDLYFDLYDSGNKKIAVFKYYFELESNTAEIAANESLISANCDYYQFGDCQLKYIFDNVKFETKPSTKLETSISKELNGTYTVALPIKDLPTNFSNKKAIYTIAMPEPVEGSDSPVDVVVDWHTNIRQKIILNQNVNFSFTNPAAVGQFTLMLYQDDIGRHSVLWPSDVKWSDGTAPDLTLGASKLDIVTCFYDLVNYYCQYGLNFS